MINEAQKQTTKEYRKGWDKIWKKPQYKKKNAQEDIDMRTGKRQNVEYPETARLQSIL